MDDNAQSEMHSFGRRLADITGVVQGLVTRDATTALHVANLVSMFTEHKTDSKLFMGEARKTLAEINEQVTTTNGRVNGHDDHFDMNDREIRDIKETLAKVMWLIFGLFATVVGGVIVFWVTHK